MALGWPGGWLSTRVALVGCIGLFVVLRLVRSDLSFRRIPCLWFVAPHLLFVVASVLWATLGPYNDQAGAIGNELLTWMIPVTIFFLVAGSPQGEANLKGAGRVLAGVALTVAVYSGFQALVLTGNEHLVPGPIAQITQYGREDLWFGAFRIYGTLPTLGPNFLGAFLLFPIVLSFSRTFHARGVVRGLWLLVALAGVTTLIGTYSRGATLALVVALTMLPVWLRSLKGFATVILGIALAGFLAAESPVLRYAGSLYADGQLDVSGSSRVILWQAVLHTTAEHPFGLGFNGWPRASRASGDVGLLEPPASLGAPHPAENQWMRELADRGLPGILALGLLMIGFMRATFRAAGLTSARTYAQEVLGAAGATCVGWGGVFLTGDHLMYDSVAGIFWYMLALGLAAIRDTSLPVGPEQRTRRVWQLKVDG
jgi:O-antigen ligase